MMASSILFLFISLIIFNLVGASMSMDYCQTPIIPSCNSSDKFSVQFPFRLPQYQSNILCGFNSSFSLSCNPHNKQTLLYIPNSGSFAINDIDYCRQTITVTDPDGCLANRFRNNFSLSSSAFSLPSSSYYQNFTYYKCARKPSSESNSSLYNSYGVPCMTNKTFTVVALPTSDVWYWDPRIKEDNCTVMKSDVSVPVYFFYGKTYYYSFISLYLHWAEPQCGLCLAGQVCGFKGDSTNLVECQDIVGRSSHSSVLLLFLVPILIILVPVALVRMICWRIRIVAQQQSDHPETALVQTQLTTITTALNEPAIDSSNPVFVLSEGDVLLEPNTSPCAICLNEYKAGDMLRTIVECNHYFHSDCVDQWLRMKATCPVCRKGA